MAENLPFQPPAGATDCHLHVFGPHERYPLAAQRAYTPDEATPEALWARLGSGGISRAVLVQPSVYGTDNSRLVDALLDAPDRARGIAVVDAGAGAAELRRLHDAGVRGVRVNLVTMGGGDPRAAQATISSLAERIAPLGWHVQVFIHAANVEVVASLIDALPVPVVFDHMGMPVAADGAEQPGFRRLLELLKEGRCWVKLSGPYHVSPHPHGDQATDRIAGALVAANPDRLVWGSDWPHVGKNKRTAEKDPPRVPHRSIDYATLLALLGRWSGTAEVRDRILVDNPARLYGF